MQIANFGLSYFMIFFEHHHPDNRAKIEAMMQMGNAVIF